MNVMLPSFLTLTYWRLGGERDRMRKRVWGYEYEWENKRTNKWDWENKRDDKLKSMEEWVRKWKTEQEWIREKRGHEWENEGEIMNEQERERERQRNEKECDKGVCKRIEKCGNDWSNNIVRYVGIRWVNVCKKWQRKNDWVKLTNVWEK